MTWNCQACTYTNINDRASRCHTCGTDRPGGGSGGARPPPPAIVDLTGFSPKPSKDSRKSATGSRSSSLNSHRGDVMESNRSRRRRRMEESSSSRREAEPISLIESPDASTVDSYAGQGNAKVGSLRTDATDKHESRVGKTSVYDETGFSRSSNTINNNTCSKDASTRDADRSGTTNKKSWRVNNGDQKRSVRDEDRDVIHDPAPRKKLPFNINGSGRGNPDNMMHHQPRNGKRESKLKKRKADSNLKSGEGNASKRPSSASTSASSAKTQQHSSQSNSNMLNNKKKKGNERQSGESRLTNFFNQQKRPQLSTEDLLAQANVILRQTFKHNSLRPLQETAVRHALQRTSSIVIMATGGGKSMCYQLPALVGRGENNSGNVRADKSSVTIVVCPLIALMMDQVNNLHRKGVHTAACLSSSHSAKARQEILNRLRTDSAGEKQKGASKNQTNVTPIQLLYCTPELIQTDKFREILTKLYETNRLHMFAIDEAHCLSTWGHDFRPAYRKLTWVREAFPDVPVMAATGTATSKVIQDIRDILQMDKNTPCLMGTFNRENISYEVRFKESLDATKPQGAILDLVDVIKKQHANAKLNNQPCSGIIYVHKREDCHSLAKQIFKATGLVCLAYHAGLKDSEREETQRKWTDGSCKIAVATVAFGMGIDLPHVRYVVHWTMAKSLEGFYQESGRGGRDGKKSLSILYYSKDDASKFAFLVKKNAESTAQKKGKQNASQKADHSMMELEFMVNYCTTPICKRKYVLQHFGERIDADLCKKTCDYCLNPAKVEREIQASECMSAVVNSHRLMHSGREKQENDKQKYHHNPLDDESFGDDYVSEDFFGRDEGALGITGHAGEDDMASEPALKKGFVKASSVLNKYETLEVQEGKKGGFVNFKTRTFAEPTQDDLDAKRSRAVSVPEHLRNNMPDPLAAHVKKPGKTTEGLKNSSAYASEAERLKAELKELEMQKAAALAKMGGVLSSRSSSKPLPTPSLSFKKRR